MIAQHKREQREASDAFAKLDRQYKATEEKLSEYQVSSKRNTITDQSVTKELRASLETKDKELQAALRKVFCDEITLPFVERTTCCKGERTRDNEEDS